MNQLFPSATFKWVYPDNWEVTAVEPSLGDEMTKIMINRAKLDSGPLTEDEKTELPLEVGTQIDGETFRDTILRTATNYRQPGVKPSYQSRYKSLSDD